MKHSGICLASAIAAIGILLSAQLADARIIKAKLPSAQNSAVDSRSHETSNNAVLQNDTSLNWKNIEKKIKFYGFDKTASATAESFFIVNDLDSILNGVEVEITYFDMKGRQLHRRICEVECMVAPHETMRIDIKSWDTQKSFYYHRSAKPKRQATPFEVNIKLLKAEL